MNNKQILSRLPGIFYRKPSPESEPYKKEGDKVAVNDFIGLIEVMKSFHEVRAEVSGTIVKFIAENEAPIMPGAVIAEVS